MIEAEQMKLKNLQNKNKFSQEEEKRDEEDNGEFQYLG